MDTMAKFVEEGCLGLLGQNCMGVWGSKIRDDVLTTSSCFKREGLVSVGFEKLQTSAVAG